MRSTTRCRTISGLGTRSTAILTTVLLFTSSLLMGCEPTAGGSGSCKRGSSFMASASTNIAMAAPARPKPPKPAKPPKKRAFNCSKQSSPQWKKFKPYKGSVRTNGKSGRSARYYEWDHTHNDIEVYGPGPDYNHLGSMNPIDGDMYKGPVAGRNLKGKLK